VTKFAVTERIAFFRTLESTKAIFTRTSSKRDMSPHYVSTSFSLFW